MRANKTGLKILIGLFEKRKNVVLHKEKWSPDVNLPF